MLLRELRVQGVPRWRTSWRERAEVTCGADPALSRYRSGFVQMVEAYPRSCRAPLSVIPVAVRPLLCRSAAIFSWLLHHAGGQPRENEDVAVPEQILPGRSTRRPALRIRIPYRRCRADRGLRQSQFDPQPFHLDATAAAQSFFKGLVASGWHTGAITMRLLVQGELQIAGGMIGGGGELTWPNATRPGDTLQVHSEVIAITPSRSRPDRGTILLRSETRNQKGEALQVLTARLVVPRRPVP